MTKEKGILGIDYGETNIGLAFGRAGEVLPLKIISGKNPHTAISVIGRTIIEYDAKTIIVGLPLTMENKETSESLKVRRFVKLLKVKIKKPVVFVNEHSTSKDATKIMLSMGVSQKRRRLKDHYSAALILKKYYREKE